MSVNSYLFIALNLAAVYYLLIEPNTRSGV
jgi:hypothetical protein